MELVAILQPLCADSVCAMEAMKKDDSQYNRRVFVRAVFASIEGMTSLFKALAIEQESDTPGSYSPAEVAVLKEESYFLGTNGRARTRPNYTRLTDGFRFALDMYHKNGFTKWRLDTSDKNWELFRKSLDIRHRITHPKDVEDLTISDEDKKTVYSTHRWIYSTVIQSLLDEVKAGWKLNEELKCSIIRVEDEG